MGRYKKDLDSLNYVADCVKKLDNIKSRVQYKTFISVWFDQTSKTTLIVSQSELSHISNEVLYTFPNTSIHRAKEICKYLDLNELNWRRIQVATINIDGSKRGYYKHKNEASKLKVARTEWFQSALDWT
jgi:hypothetical protein